MLRRQKTQQDELAQSAATQRAAAAAEAAGKGRPTPSRREAEAARKQRVKPVLNQREAMRRQREKTRADRLRTRQAMAEGDSRYYLPRDQGPVRQFVRDFVDSRRTLAEYFLPIIVVILVLTLVPIAEIQVFGTIAWLAVMVVMVVDLVLLSRKVKREIAKRFPDDDSRGNGLYAVSRATQMRRLRLPKPQVKPGTLV